MRMAHKIYEEPIPKQQYIVWQPRFAPSCRRLLPHRHASGVGSRPRLPQRKLSRAQAPPEFSAVSSRISLTASPAPLACGQSLFAVDNRPPDVPLPFY